MVPRSGKSVDAATFRSFVGKFSSITQTTFVGKIFGDGFNWDNVMIAGGCVTKALIGEDRATANHLCSRRDSKEHHHYHGHQFCATGDNGDIDVFIYGLTGDQAMQKLSEMHDHFQKLVPATVRRKKVTHADRYPFEAETAWETHSNMGFVRTKGSFTFAIGDQSVQVILRLYKSRPEILMAFDLDSCAVGFDGTTVWALPRARRALNGRFNLVDETRPNVKYEARLLKYSDRGFGVGVPGLDPYLSNISPQCFGADAAELSGLGKLVRIEMMRRMDLMIDCEAISMSYEPCIGSDDKHLMMLRDQPKVVEEDFWRSRGYRHITNTDIQEEENSNRRRQAHFKWAASQLIGHAGSWYDAWRMSAGIEGFHELARQVEEYKVRHRYLQAEGGAGADGLSDEFIAPVLLADSFETAVHGGSQGSSVPAAITWHVADPTRRYIGGFTAEGVDFYGSMLWNDRASGISQAAQDLESTKAKVAALSPPVPTAVNSDSEDVNALEDDADGTDEMQQLATERAAQLQDQLEALRHLLSEHGISAQELSDARLTKKKKRHDASLMKKGPLSFGVHSSVYKEFDGEIYSGTCTDIDEETGLYHIVYEDKDEEDLNAEELAKILKAGKENQVSNNRNTDIYTPTH
jgi:hypothetical protein